MNETPRLELVVDNDEEIIPAKPGMKPPPPTDWLSGMPSDTHFRVRDKTGRYLPEWIRMEYIHGGKLYGEVLLIPAMSLNKTETWNWVEPTAFCRIFELTSVTEEPEEP